MNSEFRFPLINFLLMMLTLLIGMGFSYHAAKKGQLAPLTEVSQRSPATNPDSQQFQRFFLGEIIVPARDEELHLIKVEIELRYRGGLENTYEERKWEMKEMISQTLARMTIQRVKEDFADGFLQKEIERSLNTLLQKTTDPNRIEKVTIASFLIS